MINIFFKVFVRAVIIACIIGVILFVYCMTHITSDLTITHYTIEADIQQDIRIVQLSDLHGAEYGDDNWELMNEISQLSPDLIVFTGDMQNKDDENTDIVVSLIQKLSTVAPVYIGMGNHEYEWEKTYGQSLINKYETAGAMVLEQKYVDIEINGVPLRIAGYAWYYRAPVMITSDEKEKEVHFSFCDEFENTQRYKILLNHIPTSWLEWEHMNSEENYQVDIVFSGHYHGGQIILPVIGGVFSPYSGLFADYTSGIYIGSSATCVLSAGLGSEYVLPRVNNPPEIVVVDINSKIE